MRYLIRLATIFIITITFLSCINKNGNGSLNPEITDVKPTSGPPGTAVTISGHDFSPKPKENNVSFGGSAASISQATESTLKTIVPGDAETGPIKVTVDDNTAKGPQFTVEAKAPGITTIEPDNGTVGTEITIAGENFSTTPTENTVSFNGTQAIVKTASADQLVTEVPQGATDGPVQVTVEQKSATGPKFDVITDGTLEVHTTTTGNDKDNNGYEVSVDGNTPRGIENTGMATFSDLEEGSYQLELSGIANNCSVSGNNPRTVAITAGDTTSTTYEINCHAPTIGRIVFTSDRDGDTNIYSMKPDGSDLQKLTNTTGLDAFPVVSNDGSKIAFSSTRGSGGLFIMDADGTNVEQVISNGSAAYGLSWSPDDTKLVYTGTVNKKSQLMIISIDGTGKEQLTTDGGVYPSWSPDGSKIAFSSHRDSDNEIYTINPDGTGLTQITDNYVTGDGQPRWSPDGSKILFISDRIDAGYDIYTMDSDGTNVQRITYGKSYNGNTSWSPDGSEITFQSDRTGDKEVFKINADGSGTATNLTNSASTKDTFPSWGPIK